MSRYLHVEGVNFDRTIFDTSDVSTIRGASCAYEDIVAGLAEQLDSTSVQACSASKLIAKSDRTYDDLVEKLPNDLKRLLKYLSFAHGTGSSLAEAEVLMRINQLQNWSTAPPMSGDAPCALSKTLPAERPTKNKGKVSASVYDRRSYGIRHRRQVAGRTALPPAQDFEDLIAAPPAWVPLAARHKMAVVHADGAGFGTALAKLQYDAGEEVGLKLFSSTVQELQQELIEQAVMWAATQRPVDVLPFEFLLAGGDDLLFVLPGWQLLEFLGRFEEWTAGITIKGSSVHFRLGAIIADRRTPIRQMTGLAYEAVDALRATKAEGSLFSIDVFESAALPMDGISAHRVRLYGKGYEDAEQSWPLAQADALKIYMRCLRTGDANSLPRSQIYRALRDLPDLISTEETVIGRLQRYSERTGRAHDITLPGARSLNPALHLAWAAQLWDYCGEEP